MVKKKKEEEFLAFKQGNLSVGEYTTMFEELAQFYQLAQYAPNGEWKITRYKLGLHGDISHSLDAYPFTNYASLVQQAYVEEEGLKRMYHERKEFWQKKKGTGTSTPIMKPKGNINKGKQVQQSGTEVSSLYQV